jgi:hypothetical protein
MGCRAMSEKYLWRVIIATLCIVGCADEYYSLLKSGDKYECNHIIEKHIHATTHVETLSICDTAAECKAVCDTERAKKKVR